MEWGLDRDLVVRVITQVETESMANAELDELPPRKLVEVVVDLRGHGTMMPDTSIGRVECWFGACHPCAFWSPLDMCRYAWVMSGE